MTALHHFIKTLTFFIMAIWINGTVAAPYQVGNSTIFIHDYSRPIDSVAEVTKGVRTLITEIWYPVEHAAITPSTKKSTYGDYVFGNKAVHQLMMTKTTFFHLTPDTVKEGITGDQIDTAIEELFTRERNSYPDAPIAKTGAPFPVIVLSHGDAGSRYNMESMAEHLASQGYFIIAPEHTGNAPFSMLGSDPTLKTSSPDSLLNEILPRLNKDGLYAYDKPEGQSFQPLATEANITSVRRLDSSLMDRINDLRAAIDEMSKLNQQGPFADRIDLENIGVTGRSFGGLTSLLALDLEPRFRAGFAVVPAPLPDIKLNKLFRFFLTWGKESALFGLKRENGIQKFYKPTAIIVGEEDTLLINASREYAKAFNDTLPSQKNRYPSLLQTFQRSQLPTVWYTLKNSNHGSLAVAGPYWWPTLTPNRFPRNFTPEEEYQLIDSQLAHKIQSERALAFFDIYLKGKTEKTKSLLAPDKNHLEIEAKNF